MLDKLREFKELYIKGIHFQDENQQLKEDLSNEVVIRIKR